MNQFIDAQELSILTGCNRRKAAMTIQEANRRIKASGGITLKAKAPRKLIEQMLYVDLTVREEQK